MRFAGGGAAVSVKSEKLSGGVRLARFGLAFAFGLGLSGCGGRPTGFLDPHAGFVAPPGGTTGVQGPATGRSRTGAETPIGPSSDV